MINEIKIENVYSCLNPGIVYKVENGSDLTISNQLTTASQFQPVLLKSTEFYDSLKKPSSSSSSSSKSKSKSSTFKKRNPFHGIKRRKKSKRRKDPVDSLNFFHDDKENIPNAKSKKLPKKLSKKLNNQFDITLPSLFCEMPVVDLSQSNNENEIKIKQEIKQENNYNNRKKIYKPGRRRSLRKIKTVINNNDKKIENNSFYIWYPCGECEQKFTSGRLLIYHVLKEHPYYSCKKCNKIVKNKSELKIHLKGHFDSKKSPFKCDECDASYTILGNLVKHKDIHTTYKLPTKLVLSYNVKEDPDKDLINDAASTVSIIDDDYDHLS